MHSRKIFLRFAQPTYFVPQIVVRLKHGPFSWGGNTGGEEDTVGGD